MQQTLTDTRIKIIPSESLLRTISELKSEEFYLTETLRKIQKNQKIVCGESKTFSRKYCSESDLKFVDELKSNSQDIEIEAKELFKLKLNGNSESFKNNVSLTVDDLKCLKDIFNKLNANSENKIYLNEIIRNCEIHFPKNEIIPRNPQLEQRCQELHNQQKNLEYRAMTKNVDSVRAKLPQDTISYQLREINKQLIAVVQFIISILAGFAFGFIGIELIVGNLDFGFRLLLGIMCALIIALAEIYFLAKKLNDYSDFLDRNKEELKFHPNARFKANTSTTKVKMHQD